jgi:6-phosphogluconolactonase
VTVLRSATDDEVAASVADALVATLAEAQSEGREPSVVLTGGTIARKVHTAVAQHAERDRVDWSAVHLWWGDERFVSAGDEERNEGQARADLVDRLPFDPEKVHAVPPDDGTSSVEDAAAAYATVLERHVGAGRGAGRDAGRDAGETPWFDVLMLGIGPDGHCASLFPGRPEVAASGVTVAVRDSPKPPPQRVSLTMATLGRARQVWFVASGEGKAAAVARSVTGGDVHETPSAGPRGTEATRWYVDEAAASTL